MPTQTEIDHDYKRLKVLLEDTDSFVLTFVLYRDIKEQRKNAEKLKDRLDLPITEVALKGDNLNPIYTFLDLPKEPRQAIFYTFLGSSLPEGKSDFDKFAGYVNIQREAFTDAPHAVVLWLREEQLVRLMRRAPDFWAWRSGVFDVRGKLQPDTSPSPYLELEEVNAFERGELEEQVALYREILKGQLERDEPDLAYVARTRLRLADALYKLGLYKETINEAQKVIKLARVLENNELLLSGLSSSAEAQAGLGHYSDAEPIYREVIEASAKTQDQEHPNYAAHISNLAGVLAKLNQYDEAENLYRKAMRIEARDLGREHYRYAVVLNNLASLLADRNRHSEAEQLFREALDINAELLSKEHPNYIGGLNNLASLLYETEQFDEAEQLYREALVVGAKVMGNKHPKYANILNGLANLLRSLGRYEEAAPLYYEALTICNDILGIDHPNTQLVAKNCASFFRQLEQQTPNS